MLLQNPCWIAASIAQNRTIGQIGRGRADVSALQGQGVDPQQVSIFAPQRYWMFGRGGIQRGFRRELLSGPEILIPLTSQYPLPGGSLRRSIPY